MISTLEGCKHLLRVLAPLPGCNALMGIHEPVVSLRSTTGYEL
jgi:hypothetical protein